MICDSRKKPRWVRTRSQNWTKTGLCTQANNSVLNACIFVGRSLKTRVQGFRVVRVHDQNRVLAFHRWVEGQGHDVMVVAHLSPFHRFGYRIGFPSGGDWRESFNSDVYENWVNPGVVGNGGQVIADPHPMHEFAFSATLVLPANSILVFTR